MVTIYSDDARGVIEAMKQEREKDPSAQIILKKKTLAEKESKVDFASDEAAEEAVNKGLSKKELSNIKGSGKKGSITVKDVKDN